MGSPPYASIPITTPKYPIIAIEKRFVQQQPITLVLKKKLIFYQQMNLKLLTFKVPTFLNVQESEKNFVIYMESLYYE